MLRGAASLGCDAGRRCCQCVITLSLQPALVRLQLERLCTLAVLGSKRGGACCLTGRCCSERSLALFFKLALPDLQVRQVEPAKRSSRRHVPLLAVSCGRRSCLCRLRGCRCRGGCGGRRLAGQLQRALSRHDLLLHLLLLLIRAIKCLLLLLLSAISGLLHCLHAALAHAQRGVERLAPPLLLLRLQQRLGGGWQRRRLVGRARAGRLPHALGLVLVLGQHG